MRYSPIGTYKLLDDLTVHRTSTTPVATDDTSGDTHAWKSGEAFVLVKHQEHGWVFMAADGSMIGYKVVRKLENASKKDLFASPKEWRRRKEAGSP